MKGGGGGEKTKKNPNREKKIEKNIYNQNGWKKIHTHAVSQSLLYNDISFQSESAGNGVSETLNFKLFWGDSAQYPFPESSTLKGGLVLVCALTSELVSRKVG